MSLYIIATPIGNPDDITLRAQKVLAEADLIVGEERKPLGQLLKSVGLSGRKTDFLNEHSDEKDFGFLLNECRSKKVALVSDCGTPGFCDPGAQLVSLCRKEGIDVVPLPGASSLMTLIAASGLPLKNFVFVGFLPAKKEERVKTLKDIQREKRPQVLMDTPYRLEKLLGELAELMPARKAVIGLDMTSENEEYIEDQFKNLKKQLAGQKREFVLILQ